MVIVLMAWVLLFEYMLYREAGVVGLSDKAAEFVWKSRGMAGGRGPWPAEKLIAGLEALTGQHIRVALGIADYRHMAIEIGCKIRGLAIRQAGAAGAARDADEDSGLEDKLIGEVQGGQGAECIWDLAAIHSSSIALQHYALDVWYLAKLLLQMVENYWEISRL